jgi:hypothetical protein
VKKRPVGRPKGANKKTSDAARIRKVLDRYGCTLEANEIKRLCCTPSVVGPVMAKRFKRDKSLGVKVSQEQTKMIRAKCGIARKTKGRMSNLERNLVRALMD